MLENTSSGAFVVNDTIVQIINAELPFGGVGFSGQGRYHGKVGFETFSNMKSILVKPSLDMYPFNMIFPPYTDSVKRDIMFSLRFAHLTQAGVGWAVFWFSLIVTSLVLVFKFVNF